jgi:hypothetical protein
VPNIRGELVSVKDFMNSREYPQVDNVEPKDHWEFLELTLWEIFIGEKDKAKEYVYSIRRNIEPTK